MLNKILTFLILIILFCGYIGASGLSPAKVVVRPNAEINPPKDSPTSEGGGNKQIVMQGVGASLNITRQIIRPLRKDGFFEGEDTIEVLVKITALKKEGIDKIEIWEISGDRLQIINCSYPLRTSSIKELLDYEVSDKSFIRNTDIVDAISLRSILSNHTIINNDTLAIAFLYKKLSNETIKALNYDLTDGENCRLFTNLLLHDLNRFVNDQNFGMENQNIKKIKHILGQKKVASLEGELFDEETDYNKSTEYKIINRRLIEYAFSGLVKNLSVHRVHDDLQIDEGSNAININKKNMFQGESLIFKYYLKPKDIGQTSIRSIVRTEDFIKEDFIPINIIKRDPYFEIWYTCPSKEITMNETTEFHYYIRYLGGDEDEKNFTVRINPVKNPPTGEIYCDVEMPKQINRTFTRGNTEDFIVNATYKIARKAISPPSISIDGKLDKFVPDISVFSSKDMVNKMSYESFSLEYQNMATNFSRYLLYITIISVLAAICNILFLWRESSHGKDDRVKHTEILDKITQVLEKINK